MIDLTQEYILILILILDIPAPLCFSCQFPTWGSLPIRPETFSFCDDFVDYDGCYYDENGCEKDNYHVKVTLTMPLYGSESDEYLKAVEEPLGKYWKAKTHEKRNFCT